MVADVLLVSMDSSDDLLLRVGDNLKFVMAGLFGDVAPAAAAAAARAAACPGNGRDKCPLRYGPKLKNTHDYSMLSNTICLLINR